MRLGLLAALLPAGLPAASGIGLHRAARSAQCSRPRLRQGGVDRHNGGFDAVLSACQCDHDKPGLEEDSYMLSGLFLMKQLMPQDYSRLNFKARVDDALQRYVAPAGNDCGSIFGDKTMAYVDFWYFTGVQHGFGPLPSARPSDAWVQCLVDQLPGGPRAKKPQGPTQALEQFITGMELHQVSRQPSRALVEGAEAASREADAHFTDEACEPGKPLAEMCGYYYTHQLLKQTRLMTQLPQGTEGAEAVRKYSDKLRRSTVPFLEKVRRAGPLPLQAVDLAGEVAFCLKAIARAGDEDRDVQSVVGLLREAGAPSSNCHGAVTFFFGTSPEGELTETKAL